EGLRVFLILLENLRDPTRLRVRRGREKHRVQQAENAGVHTDPEGQDKHGRDGEARRLPQLSKSKLPISHHILEMQGLGRPDSGILRWEKWDERELIPPGIT